MTTKSLRCIGQDDGHDTIKTCYGFDQATKSYRYGYHKSRAVQGLQQILSVGSKSGVAYETEGEQFTVADGQALIRTLDTRTLDYPTSHLNRVPRAQPGGPAGTVIRHVNDRHGTAPK